MTATQQETLAAMQVLLTAEVPVLLWGDPGTGKTQTVESFAWEAGWHMESVIASLHDPTDFGGLPVRSESGVVFEPPAWARRVADCDGDCLVFFDEVNTATPATQNALMRVVLEGRVGELDLGAGVRFAAAANPPSQNSGAWDLSAPLANRFAHLDWPVTLEEWKTGYLGQWPTPAPLDAGSSRADAEAAAARFKVTQAAFLTSRPALLCAVPETDLMASRGWPSPRSWERLARCLAAAEAAGASETVRMLIAAALVGEGTAAEYVAYLRNLDLPDPQRLLDDPGSFAELERSDQQFVALEAVLAAVAADPKRWRDGFTVCIAAAALGAPDVAAAVAARLVKIKPATTRLPSGYEVFAEILADAGLLDQQAKAA